MRPKPLFGDPCNNCGACCLAGPCGVAEALLGATVGRCPALRQDPLGGYLCGILTEAPLPEAAKEAAAVAIGAGLGCDATITLGDQIARIGRRAQLVDRVMQARATLSPDARRWMTLWRLAPPE